MPRCPSRIHHNRLCLFQVMPRTALLRLAAASTRASSAPAARRLYSSSHSHGHGSEEHAITREDEQLPPPPNGPVPGVRRLPRRRGEHR